jgi:hypothetical protein
MKNRTSASSARLPISAILFALSTVAHAIVNLPTPSVDDRHLPDKWAEITYRSTPTAVAGRVKWHIDVAIDAGYIDIG